MERNHQNPKPINLQNHHNLKKKSQKEVVHLWVDHNARETLTYSNNRAWLMTNHLYLSSTITYQLTKSIWQWSHQATKTKFKQSPVHDKFSIPTQFIYNILCFSMGRIIKKSEVLSAAHDFCHMINWEKREINILTRVNLQRPWNIMKELCHFSSGLNIMRNRMIRDPNLMRSPCHNFHPHPWLLWTLHNPFPITVQITFT